MVSGLACSVQAAEDIGRSGTGWSVLSSMPLSAEEAGCKGCVVAGVVGVAGEVDVPGS